MTTYWVLWVLLENPVSTVRESEDLNTLSYKEKLILQVLKEILDLCQNLYFPDVIHKIF